MHPYNFFVRDQTSPSFFFVERRRDRSRSTTFPLVDIFIHSGDIRDRSVKLRKIAPNYTRFCPPIFQGGQSPQKLYPLDHAYLAARRREKFGEVAFLTPKL